MKHDDWKLKDSEIRRRRGGSIRGAIEGKCTECIYDPESQGTLNQQIDMCGGPDCPLYAHRKTVANNPLGVAQPACHIKFLNEPSKAWNRKLALINENLGKGTERGAVDAYCIECTFDANEPGNWREQVSACTVRKCPLFSKRAETAGKVIPINSECSKETKEEMNARVNRYFQVPLSLRNKEARKSWNR